MAFSARCPDCATLVPDWQNYCPGCGRPRRALRGELEQQASSANVPYDLLLQQRRTQDHTVEGMTHMIAEYVARRASEGWKRPRIQRDLIDTGVPSQIAYPLVDAMMEHRAEALGMSGLRNMGIGLLIGLIGVCVTAGTYLVADPGGTFVLAWGAVGVGGLSFVYGAFQFWQSRA